MNIRQENPGQQPCIQICLIQPALCIIYLKRGPGRRCGDGQKKKCIKKHANNSVHSYKILNKEKIPRAPQFIACQIKIPPAFSLTVE